jgi:hypothetical protein
LPRSDPVTAAQALAAVTRNVLWSWRTAYAADEAARALPERLGWPRWTELSRQVLRAAPD